eukprot:CAMPEP_0180642290 /NCGR_PEP_ID=MMETSP1037_2-20121125/47105_1 /TAXON_ID=632150 /ORGANISM="Azadinium spinosum, Strain 3D9" /LENGTH=51 /DNA_ID=CAMNT_0022665527 /DNA_START=98 /DNA_END=250 /DNA_ORIENTATION=-
MEWAGPEMPTFTWCLGGTRLHNAYSSAMHDHGCSTILAVRVTVGSMKMASG